MTEKDDLDEHELAELSKEVAKRLERRGVLQAGAGLAAGGAAGYLASGRASAGSQQTGTIGSGGSPVDVIAEDIYGPGGQGSGDSVAFESVETGSLVDKSSGNSYDVDGLNVPDWEEDPNSPLTISGSTSGTISLANEYDVVRSIIVDGSTSAAVAVRLNGDSGSNYVYTDASGTASSGATEFPRVVNPDRGSGTETFFAGRWESNATINNRPAQASQAAVNGGRNGSIVSPLDSITYVSPGSTSFDLTARIYGFSP